MQKGFTCRTHDSQVVFRTVLDAMANPGTIHKIPVDAGCEGRIDMAAGAVLLMLLDFETPLWSDLDNNSKEIQWLRFHTGAPYTYHKKSALFGLTTDMSQPVDMDAFNPGTIEAPHQSTTLMIQIKGIAKGQSVRLTGPGIETEKIIQLDGLNPSIFEDRNQMAAQYPLGIDMIFTCQHQLVAIPRTTHMKMVESLKWK